MQITNAVLQYFSLIIMEMKHYIQLSVAFYVLVQSRLTMRFETHVKPNFGRYFSLYIVWRKSQLANKTQIFHYKPRTFRSMYLICLYFKLTHRFSENPSNVERDTPDYITIYTKIYFLCFYHQIQRIVLNSLSCFCIIT